MKRLPMLVKYLTAALLFGLTAGCGQVQDAESRLEAEPKEAAVPELSKAIRATVLKLESGVPFDAEGVAVLLRCLSSEDHTLRLRGVNLLVARAEHAPDLYPVALSMAIEEVRQADSVDARSIWIHQVERIMHASGHLSGAPRDADEIAGDLASLE